MADDTTQALREMARHRGLKLRASRRRKPGGDFGRFGLEDAAGKPVLGIGKDGLTASADEIEAHLRGAMHADWAGSTKGIKRKAAPKPPPKPKPKPRFRPRIANLFAKLPAAKRAEAVTELLAAPGVRIERIVSSGQTTPEDVPMEQEHDEWVIVLQGEAAMRIEDSAEVTLEPGDHLTIARGQRHWVTRTASPTVWLAVHIG